MSIGIINRLKKYYFNRMAFKNFIKLLISMFIVLIFALVLVYKYSYTSTYNEIFNINDSSVENYSVISDALLYDTKNKIFDIMINEDIKFFLYSQEPEKMITDFKTRIENILDSYVVSNEYIHSIAVYSSENNMICGANKENKRVIDDKGWFDEYKNSKDKLSLTLRRIEDRYPYVITMIQKTDVIGVDGAIVVNIDVERLNKYISNEKNKEIHIFAADKNNIILNSNNTELWGKQIPDITKTILKTDKKHMIAENGEVITKVVSSYFDIVYLGYMSSDVYLGKVTHLRLLIILISIFFLLCGVIISFLFSQEAYKPIGKIVSILGLHKNSEMKKNEIEYVAEYINRMLNDNIELKQKVESNIQKTNSLQLALLSTQMNAHFINNTINIINGQICVETGPQAKSSKLMIKFSKLLKECYDINKVYATVKEEIEYNELYTELLAARYTNTFTIKKEIDPDVLECKIPKKILQPFIENSVFHGIVPLERMGEIRISIQKKDKKIYISICDNGVGINTKKLKEISASMELDNGIVNLSVKNVYSRCKTLYGEEFDFKYESEEGLYTKVTMVFPEINNEI